MGNKSVHGITLISFAVLKLDEFLSVELPFQLPVQLLLELEANLLDQNVNELEFELFRAEIKKKKSFCFWFK